MIDRHKRCPAGSAAMGTPDRVRAARKTRLKAPAAWAKGYRFRGMGFIVYVDCEGIGYRSRIFYSPKHGTGRRGGWRCAQERVSSHPATTGE